MSNSPDIFLPTTITGVASNLLTGKLVSDGEPVTATVTNRVPRVNAANENYLHDLLRKLHNSSGEFLWNQPIAPDVEIGHFVYYSKTTRQFEKALAKYILENGTFRESDTSAVWGLVVDVKYNKADICINGLCNLTPSINIYKTLGATGALYLSDIMPGAPSLTLKFPYKCLGYLIGVKSSGETQVFVKTNLSADPRLHEHRSYELAAKPSGSWQVQDGSLITTPNQNIAGWLPADHEIFGNKAPSNAIYGYNPNYLGGCNWPLVFATACG
jgi:hypothetical protein